MRVDYRAPLGRVDWNIFINAQLIMHVDYRAPLGRVDWNIFIKAQLNNARRLSRPSLAGH